MSEGFKDPKWEILLYPHHKLLKPELEDVTVFDDEFKFLCGYMLRLMYSAPGIGLAANQVGWNKRVIVFDVSGQAMAVPATLVNPVIHERKGRVLTEVEGCLSFPGITARIPRHDVVVYTAKTLEGEEFTLEIAGPIARCIQHEVDHLEGKTILDYLSTAKKVSIKKKLERLKKSHKTRQDVEQSRSRPVSAPRSVKRVSQVVNPSVSRHGKGSR